ncbi:MAG: hypothetical protein NVS4B2_11480 [Chloroflexota bacterium]
MVILQAMTNELEDLTTMGSLLRERRDALGLSRAKIAGETGVTPTYIYLIEQSRSPKGRHAYKPRSDVLLRWAAALQLDLEEVNKLLRLSGYDPIESDDAWYHFLRSRATPVTGASKSAEPSAVATQRGPTKKEIAHQRAELLDEIRELFHEAVEQGQWEEVRSHMRTLIEHMKYRLELKP